MLALQNPANYVILGAWFFGGIVFYLFGPSLLQLLSFAIGVSDLDLGLIIQGPVDRFFLALNFLFTI